MGDLAKKFGKRLLHAREYRHLQVEELARVVGVSSQTVTFWQSGKAFPKETNLQKLGEVLNVPVAWFFLDVESVMPRVVSLLVRLDELELESDKIRQELKFLLGQQIPGPEPSI